jgi:hypothetical protein
VAPAVNSPRDRVRCEPRRSRERLARRTIVAVVAAAAVWPAAPTARAEHVSSALGIPCEVRAGSGVQFCQGNLATRVESWDGVPLDANVTLPPPRLDARYPLIVELHGWGGSKSAEPATDWAREGYAVLSYSARGFGNSCGSIPSRAHPGCTEGWVHLADARYEARDTQYLAGLLADEGLVRPRRVGVTGASYGGGQSLLLAELKGRIMTPDGSFAPWRSPDGRRMRIAAAAPTIPWSDLAYALAPNGWKRDYDPEPGYGATVGVLKQSWVDALYTLGQASGFYAPPGADPEADINGWYLRVKEGEPYDTPDARRLIRQIRRYHSAHYLQDRLPAEERGRPAPLLIYNAWTDDLFPADEAIHYANKVLHRHPGAEVSLLFADGFGHPRAELTASTPDLVDETEEFFARHLKGEPGSPLGVRTFTQACGDVDLKGPFTTGRWSGQGRGTVRLRGAEPQSIDSAAGNAFTASRVDPLGAGSSCVTVPASRDPGTAVYRLSRARGDGYTLLGSPTVVAKLDVSGEFPQVATRLWDVAPDGTQTFVTRGLYRPRDGTGREVFQLHPNGWHFEAGHTAKLELLGRDPPYARPSNGSFEVTVRDLVLRLPTRQRSP